MKCITCKTNDREGKNDICSSCRLKKWRRDNPDKIKAYLKRSKEQREKVRKVYMETTREERLQYDKDYYAENREARLKKQAEIKKKKGWPYEKTDKRKKANKIRTQTRRKYPFNGVSCVKCNELAKHRHHTTIPMKVDEFLFLCDKHHNDVHGRRTFTGRKDQNGKCVFVGTDVGGSK